MTILEDDLRAALRAEAQALQVPQRPALDRHVVTPSHRRGQRWLAAAACSALIIGGVAVLAQRDADVPEPAPPAASVTSVVPDVTSVDPDLTLPAVPVTSVVSDTTESVVPVTTASLEPLTPPTETRMVELLTGFVDARIAGEGAEQYLADPSTDIPLLYSTSSGAPYERAEFGHVAGIEWPYGWTAFKVRLFAGDTVVEQLLFAPGAGDLGLEYQPDGFGTEIAPTTEAGQPVPETVEIFDGAVTVDRVHPWILFDTFGRLIPDGPGVVPTTDGGERTDWDELYLIADPETIGNDCFAGTSAPDAAALAESIQSYPDAEGAAPVAVSVGGVPALMVDVAIPPGASVCRDETSSAGLLVPVFDQDAPYNVVNGIATGVATGELMRLYLVDAPEGSSINVLVVAIVAPAETMERAAQAALPIVDSIEFRTP
jgi:hypothetical protein